MSEPLLKQFEARIDQLLHQFTTQNKQLKETEEHNRVLQQEINHLKSRQVHWEKSLSSLLDKLNDNAINDTHDELLLSPIQNELLLEEEYEEDYLNHEEEVEA